MATKKPTIEVKLYSGVGVHFNYFQNCLASWVHMAGSKQQADSLKDQ